MQIADIPWDDLRYAASGQNTAVFVVEAFAIKVGRIIRWDAARLQRLGELGYGVPISDYAPDVAVPPAILATMREVQRGGDLAHWTGETAVLIAARAVPLTARPHLTPAGIKRRCKRLQGRLWREHEMWWYDLAPGNIGRYDGRDVILDW